MSRPTRRPRAQRVREAIIAATLRRRDAARAFGAALVLADQGEADAPSLAELDRLADEADAAEAALFELLDELDELTRRPPEG